MAVVDGGRREVLWKMDRAYFQDAYDVEGKKCTVVVKVLVRDKVQNAALSFDQVALVSQWDPTKRSADSCISRISQSAMRAGNIIVLTTCDDHALQLAHFFLALLCHLSALFHKIASPRCWTIVYSAALS